MRNPAFVGECSPPWDCCFLSRRFSTARTTVGIGDTRFGVHTESDEKLPPTVRTILLAGGALSFWKL